MATKTKPRQKKEKPLPPQIVTTPEAAVATTGTQTLAYKQSILNGLVTRLEFTKGQIMPWHLEDVDAVESGLKKDLALLVERCKHDEIDLKILGIQRVIAIVERTQDSSNTGREDFNK